MRLIAVLSIFVGIPAVFVLAHIDHRAKTDAKSVAAVSVPEYAEEHIEKCFFWVTEDGKTSIPLVDPLDGK